MGKLKEGILGGFSGKVGNVVGSSCRGVEYIKSRPSKMTNPRTKGQTKQRNKFTVTQSFLCTIKPIIRIGFKDHAIDGRSAFNAAMSYNMSNAIKIYADGVDLDFPNILVSRGSLFPAKDINAKVEDGEIHFVWNPKLRRMQNLMIRQWCLFITLLKQLLFMILMQAKEAQEQRLNFQKTGVGMLLKLILCLRMPMVGSL